MNNQTRSDSRRELEICVDEPQSGRAAIAGGADRLEVCSALGLGGLTPTSGFVAFLRELTELPLHVMIRPRAGGFVYTPDERALMLRDIRSMIALEVDGVVFGALTEAGDVDFEFVQELVEASDDRHCTFHRAIDCLTSPSSALSQLADLGIRRVLSSGGASTAIEGASELAAMQKIAPSSLTIMAGSGVQSGNLAELLQRTSVTHVHGSAAQNEPAKDHVVPGRVVFCDEAESGPTQRRTNVHEVRALRAILDS